VAHGGSIELVATSESGTTFRLTLRAAELAAAPVQQDAMREAEKRASDSIVPEGMPR
jgi:hypothetical protein